MGSSSPRVVVAGHICLDIIPTFGERAGGLGELLVPGALVQVGPAVLSTGGAVSNTGLALHRLGVATRLMGKIGDDLFGEAIRGILRGYGPELAEGLLVGRGEPSSYTLVVNPPGVDRVFLHCPGANDTFAADDVPYRELRGVAWLHFGYPPLMRRFFEDDGGELESLMRCVQAQGVATSLDMARPDPASPGGRIDWRRLLQRVLPHVTVFLPSLEEILFMLDRPRLERLSGQGDVVAQCDGTLVEDLAAELLEMGAGVVVLKLGERGLYVRTAAEAARLERLAAVQPTSVAGRAAWRGRELLSSCFEVRAVGTTGCGDCTIAGFLAGVLHGLTVEETLTAAVAVGACNVEAADAVSGVPPWADVQRRIAGGWRKRPLPTDWVGWRRDARHGLLVGPRDVVGSAG